MSTIEPPARTAERTAYLVLGMHRSGTSAVTQLLALAGANLPEHVMPGDEHNERGYFEPWRIALLNDERLRSADSAWDDVFAFPFRPLPRKDERRWINRAIAMFEEEYGELPCPLLKDPRISVLLPIWRTVLADLEIAARCVIPVRHPLAVAGSLRRRDGFAGEKSVLVWSAYMLASEAYTRDLPRAFVDYDALLADWRSEAARIEDAHGAPLPRMTARAEKQIDRALTPALRHNAGQGDLAALGWAGELAQRVFDAFRPAATGGEPDREALDAAGEALSRRAEEMGALVSPATRDLDVARSDLREARARLAVVETTLKKDRDALETGWERDVRRLEALLEQERAILVQAEAELDEALRED